MRLVLDTNTILSGLLWQNHPHRLLNIVQDSKFEVDIFCSAYILDELSRNIRSSKLKKYQTDINKNPDTLITSFVGMVKHVKSVDITKPPGRYQLCEDPKDNLVLGTALAASADILVTGDGKLLKMSPWEGIEILNAKETLLQIIQIPDTNDRTVRENHLSYNADILGVGEHRVNYGVAQAA